MLLAGGVGSSEGASPESVSFQSSPPSVGQVWSHTSTSTRQMKLLLSDGETVLREIPIDETEQKRARIEILRVEEGRIVRVHVQVREAWRQEGADAPRASSPAEGRSYIAQRGPGSPSLLRADGTKPGKTESKIVIKLSDDLLGEGAASPEEALFELLAGRTIPVGEEIRLDEERAKLVFVAMPVDEAGQWSVDEAHLTLVGVRENESGSCGLFEARFAAQRTTGARVIRLRHDGEICVAVRGGRWLEARLEGPLEMRQPFDPRSEDLEVHGEGRSSLISRWRFVKDTRRRAEAHP